MANCPGLVYCHEKRGDHLKTRIPAQEHQRVLEEGIDVVQQRPSFSLPLTEVGISGKTVWINFPEGRLPFQAKIHVALASDVRGIHMSRIEELISALLQKDFPTLQAYGLELCRCTIEKQEAEKGTVFLTGQLPVVRQAPVSKRNSLDSIDITAAVNVVRKEKGFSENVMIGVGVNHITACPCTQEYYNALYRVDGESPPMPTHSQRSHSRLEVEVNELSLGHDDLRLCLESALHVTQDLLKRPDEAEIVLKAHTYPQFAEDAVREVARTAGRRFGSLVPESCRIIIESTSLESIHIHDVNCRLETSMGGILELLKQGI